MSLRCTENSAAFDRILLDLQTLISSLDENYTKTNIRRIRSSSRRNNLDEIVGKNTDSTILKSETQGLSTSPDLSRSVLRHSEAKSPSRSSLSDKVTTNQTYSPNSECLLFAKITSNGKEHASNDVTGNGEIVPVTGDHSFSDDSPPTCVNGKYNEDKISVNTNSCKYVSVTKTENGTSSKQAESEVIKQNESCPSWQQIEGISNAVNTNKQNCTVNSDEEQNTDPDIFSSTLASIQRSSPVIGRRTVPLLCEPTLAVKKSATLDGRRRHCLLEDDSNSKLSTFAYEEPISSKTLSLKRVFSRKLSPFKRKPKLKSVKSLPATANHSVAQNENTEIDHFQNLKGKVGSGEVSPESPILSYRHDLSGSPRYQRAISYEESSGSTEYIGPDGQSLLCHKKKKSSKKHFKLHKNAHKNGRNSIDIEMRYTFDKSEGHVEDLDFAHEDSPRHRVASGDASVLGSMRSASTGETSTQTARDSSRQRPQGSPIIRRSTIGTSYLRETGSSAPNIYQTENDNSVVTDDGKRKISSSKNPYRHSLHVLKDHAVIPRTKDENRWSAADGLVAQYHGNLSTFENDKTFKTSSIKSRSIFQKSVKSGSKSSNMSFAERKKLTERTWNSAEPYIWCNLNGQRVEIAEVDLLSLSESECIALQKVAEQKLREIDLGVSITVPKDESKLLHGKNNSMLRRAGVHLPLGGTKNKSKKDQDHVFSIPLVRVVENDQLLRLQTVEQDEDAFCGATNSGNDDDSAGRSSSEGSPKTTRRMSSSQDSCADQSSSGSMPSTFEKSEQKTSSPSTPPSGSPLTTRKQPGSRTLRRRGAVGLNNDTEIDDVNIKLLESLSISETKDKKRSLLPPTMPQVPYVVQKCCAHILKHGLDVTGIFRIAGSKKRVRQLREEFDHGVDVKIDENYHAHDVAALLKEFFRDLPEALLSRELYQAFISTAKLPQYQRLDALRSLVWLLPMPNRDTLQQLLSFLATVAEFSEDRVDPSGKTMGGNKMSVANLSVIFGPNILHRFKKNQSNNDTQYQVQSLERAEESTYVIKIVDDMIRSQRDLFMIPRETHDEILRTLQESDPDAVDFLLRRKAANYARSPSPKVMNDRVTSPVEEPMKRFIMGCEEMIPDRSDMNNNNKNNSSNSTIQKDLHDTRRGKQDHQSASKASTVTKLQKTSFDNNPIPDESSNQPPTYSHGNGSVTFTEEDLKDILQGDWSRTNNISRNKTGMAEKTGQSLDKNSLDLPLQTTSHSPQTNRRTSALLITTDLRHRHPATAFKTEYPRHHGLSLATKQAYIDKEEQNKSSSSRSPTVTSNNKKFRPHILQSVVSSKPGSTTPGFEDTSSTSSGSVISNRPPTPKQKKHNRINFDSNGVEMNRPSTESRQRRRQPSALTLSLHRRHETNSSNGHPLHSVRLPKQTEKKNSPDEENVVELADLEPRSYHRGRRVSKDDLYLTQQEFRRRLERQRSIMI